MRKFIFESYEFNRTNKTVIFRYSFDDKWHFVETFTFSEIAVVYNDALLQRALFLAFSIVGVSYYKLFPEAEMLWHVGEIDTFQANFLNHVYQEGLGQFAYENNLTRDDLGHFMTTAQHSETALPYDGDGIISLQSGGKDSLLTATLLEKNKYKFDSFYISAGDSHPAILDQVGDSLLTVKRHLDLENIKLAMSAGGKNGHVPVTYIVLSVALIQAILCNKKYILTSIGHEGEEPHAVIGDLKLRQRRKAISKRQWRLWKWLCRPEQVL